MSASQPRKQYLYLISDSTGELAERFTNAIVSQFPDNRIQITKFNFVQNKSDIEEVMEKCRNQDSVVYHTVLSQSLKVDIEQICQRKGIPAFDLTGPPTDFLSSHFNLSPVWDLKSIHSINDAYFKRVEAIEFTTNHDDGVGKMSASHADIILVGPSRTSKTPTSIYLAMKGYRTSNIPIVKMVGVTPQIEQLAGDRRVFGLYIHPEKLQEVRIKREKELGTTTEGYTDLESIYAEIDWAKKLYRRSKWKMIDITKNAIEETAAQVIRTLGARGVL